MAVPIATLVERAQLKHGRPLECTVLAVAGRKVEFNWTFHERDSDVDHYKKASNWSWDWGGLGVKDGSNARATRNIRDDPGRDVLCFRSPYIRPKGVGTRDIFKTAGRHGAAAVCGQYVARCC